MGKRTCWIDGCDRGGWYSGKCWAHREYVKRDHRLTRRKRGATVAERLAIYGQSDDNGCVVWTGSVNASGYGIIRINGRNIGAHRVAWRLANGPIPRGMQIDHACHNRRCINVAHLRLATQCQNHWNLRGAARSSATGVRNVKRDGSGYRVVITKNHRRYNFGTYQTMAEAKHVAADKRRELFGEYAGRG